MKRKILFLFILFASAVLAFSQQNDNSEELTQDNNDITSETVFVIDSFNYNLDGRTRIFAIVKKAELKIGEEIKGFADLEKYIKEKNQLLANERVLESANVEYTLGDARDDGKIPVNITITAVDTWNIIAIPHPKYDSNTGFSLTLKGRDYNFFGTMEPIRIDFGYRNDEEKRTFFNFGLTSNTPFRLFNLDWSFKFENFYEYRPDMDKLHFLDNTTGLSADIPVGVTTLTIGFDESFILNEENSEINIYRYGLNQFQEGLYMSSTPYLSWKIPMGLEIYNWGELTYTPKVSATFNHEVESPLDITRIGPFLGFGHSLGFGRINWIGNFLKGMSASISNSYTYDFSDIYTNPWHGNINFTLIAHNTAGDVMGISTRLMYRHWLFDDTGTKAGDALRGIIDNSIGRADGVTYGVNYMISYNIDIIAKAITFTPSEFFDNRKLRIINFNVHFSPFIDLAVYRSPYNESEFGYADITYKNLLMTGGLDVLIFPEFFRSLCLRASLGFNLLGRPNKSYTEIYIGTELNY